MSPESKAAALRQDPFGLSAKIDVESFARPLPVELPAGAEQRKAARKSLVFVVARLQHAGQETLCRVRNISPRGLMIETAVHLRDQASVRLEFPDRCDFGRVMWSRGQFAGVQMDDAFCPDKLISNYALSWKRLLWEHELLDVLGVALTATISSAAPATLVEFHAARQKFSQAIRAHLKHEIWAVYPALLRHRDPIIAAHAAHLWEGLEAFEEQHDSYTKRWITISIQDKWPQFYRETIELIQSVRSRSSQEDARLYKPLVSEQA